MGQDRRAVAITMPVRRAHRRGLRAPRSGLCPELPRGIFLQRRSNGWRVRHPDDGLRRPQGAFSSDGHRLPSLSRVGRIVGQR